MIVRLVDSKGKQVENQFMVRGQRRALAVEPRMSDSTGVSEITVQAYKSGKLSIRAYARGVKGGNVIGQLEIDFPQQDRKSHLFSLIILNRLPVLHYYYQK